MCGIHSGSSDPSLLYMDVLQVCGEKSRFEKLMEYFCREDSNIDFMVKMLLRVQSPGAV